MKSSTIIDEIEYNWELRVMKPSDDKYKFSVQIWGNGKIYPFVMWLAEETVEDEIDSKKDLKYLETLAVKVVENHLEDMIKNNEGTVAKKLKYWFKEAKEEVDISKNDRLTNAKNSI